MASIATTGVTLSSDFYLSKFYKDNRSTRKSSGRLELSDSELSYEDARALRRAVKQLSSYKFSDEENADNIRNTVKAFVSTYNNALSSTGGNSSSEINRYAKKLKELATKYGDELNDIGVTKKSDGTLSVSDNLLKAADTSKLKKIFSKEDSSLLKTTEQIAKRLLSNSYNDIYTQLTGNGGKLNITL